MWEISAVFKRNDSNCVEILSNQRLAATASNLNEYTIESLLFKNVYFVQIVMTLLVFEKENVQMVTLILMYFCFRVGVNEASALRELREQFFCRRDELLRAFKRYDQEESGV